MAMRTMKINVEQPLAEEIDVNEARVINIQNDAGETMYHIMMREDGSLEVRSSGFIKIEGRVKDTRLLIQPEASNSILISRPDYE